MAVMAEARSSENLALARAALAAKAKEALEVIKDDLSQWLTQLLQREVASSDFMNFLDTGVVLCKLAEMVQDASKKAGKGKPKWKFRVPMEPLSCNVNAKSGTSLGEFQSRVNTSNFIKWCRELGVEEPLIFESEGLVLHKDEKRVILCLLDVARFAERVGLPPPQLVRLEREIEMLEEESTSCGGNDVGQPEGALLSNIEESQLIPLKDIGKINVECEENGTSGGMDIGCKENGNGSSNGFHHHNGNNFLMPNSSPRRLTPPSSASSSPSSASPKHSTSRIPVRTPGSSVKHPKSPSPRSRSNSVPSNAEAKKRWRRSGDPSRRCSTGKEAGEGKEKVSEGAATGDTGGPALVRASPGKKQRVGSVAKKESRTKATMSEKENKEVSTASVEERVMKQVKQCTCQNKIEVISKGNGKFLVRGASGKSMTVYARILRNDRLMVRIGGGWDTLDHFLLKNDPCRLHAVTSEYTVSKSPERPKTPTSN